MATNPIDRCWRCRENWTENHKRLALCGLGFGRKATGGDEGDYYLVTDNSDYDDIHIKLSKELIVQSNKTIDGRGVNVHIAHGCGITLQFVHNVIIHNVHIHHIIESQGGLIRDSEDHYGYRTVGDGDGISIFGSSNIWLDHISMSESQDGLIDVIQGSTAITISNCHFTHHDHGFFHVVNNDYTHWKMYAIGGSTHPTIISEGNRYIAPDDPNTKEITNRNYAPESEWKNWVWRSEGDLYMNGAFFRTSGPPSPPNLNFSEKDVIKAKPATFVRRLTRFAGTLNCKKYVKC
ncbi:hypothetical protein J1N35_015773 [Gossypium stocksii]|uniref:Pectate lyase domain-containing protein n=1 Tax=Gossypium stocksii TaxID=47602 RepID=A0A9D3VX03_9ROSI|nr:hypothetical protein J1N35_015773 [Gossypium stocksii]